MTAIQTPPPMTRPERLFSSVFPPPSTSGHADSRYEEAWQLTTSCIVKCTTAKSQRHIKPPQAHELQAFQVLLQSDESRRGFLAWYVEYIRSHYVSQSRDELDRLWKDPIPCAQAARIVNETIAILWKQKRSSLEPLDVFLRNLNDIEAQQTLAKLRNSVQDHLLAITLHTLPEKRLSKTLSFVIHESLFAWLINGTASSGGDAVALLQDIRQSGLNQRFGQRAFAHAMNALLDSYVQSREMKVDWVGRQAVTGRLRQWVRNVFVPAARSGLVALTGDEEVTPLDTEVSEWESVALKKLADHRLKYLFEYVKAWDHSMGAILDLKDYMHVAADGKVRVANAFTQQMNRRVLHAGVTTAELLGIYINVISTFKTLDARGVLLDKVALPLRSYLRQRDDTVRIIAASFLADVDSEGNVLVQSDEICKDLSRELALAENEDSGPTDKMSDWNDMNWMPDPIDAGPDYRKSHGDILSFVLTLFERADFIKEVQTMLGERLLAVGADNDLEREMRLVELFKARFGAEGLQSCEVMLRDVRDSRRINTALRPSNSPKFPTLQEIHAAIPEEGITITNLLREFRNRIPQSSAANQQFIKLLKEVAISEKTSGLLIPRDNNNLPQSPPRLHSLILSSFFWPSLREEDFTIPAPIAALEDSFGRDFERIKNLRKLHWLPALGRATVELELQDRTVKLENVHTWQASVIYAFQNTATADADTDVSMTAAEDPPITKTVQELETALSMDEALVRNALHFWTNHRVLIESAHHKDTFTVLETLPSSTSTSPTAPTAQPPQPPDSAAMSAVKSQDAVLRDNKEMYQLFMVGMLTNGGVMDAARVTMMLKMVVPGGYAFEEDETRWLLGDLVEQGRVVEVGGGFGVKK